MEPANRAMQRWSMDFVHDVKKRKLFPSDDSAKKVVYLAIKDASKKWTMPIRNWRQAMSRFMIEFEERLTDHV